MKVQGNGSLVKWGILHSVHGLLGVRSEKEGNDIRPIWVLDEATANIFAVDTREQAEETINSGHGYTATCPSRGWFTPAQMEAVQLSIEVVRS